MAERRNSIIRLSRYKNELFRFRELGFVRIYSEFLAEAVGGTGVQVRKDFSQFGITGSKRGGYSVDQVIERLNQILHNNEVQEVIVVGAGNLGCALIKYKNFGRLGIRIVAAFDIDPAKISVRADTPVYSLTELATFVTARRVTIAMLCVPDVAAQSTVEKLHQAGIRGILNFSPMQIKVPGDMVISSVNLEVELENLIYFVNHRDVGC